MASVVRGMNEVTLRRARLVLGWIGVFGRAYTITVRNQPTGSTQPCIPPGSLNRVPASAGSKGWNVTSAGWQVTLCDPICCVSSSSGVATSVSKLLYPCYYILVTCYSMNARFYVYNLLAFCFRICKSIKTTGKALTRDHL